MIYGEKFSKKVQYFAVGMLRYCLIANLFKP